MVLFSQNGHAFPWQKNNAMSLKSDEIRIRYLYRNLILRGKIKLSLESARKLIGPDCAYHLYAVMDLKKSGKKRKD